MTNSQTELDNYLEPIDIYSQFQNLFNDEIQAAFDKSPATRQVDRTHVEVDGIMVSSVHMSEHFCVRVKGEHNIPKAVKMISDTLNQFSPYIVKPLIKLSRLRLLEGFIPVLNGKEEYAVYSVPIMNAEGSRLLKENPPDTYSREGEIIKVTIEDPI